MPRKKFVQKRKIRPDLVYNSIFVAKFINSIMKCGKKSLAERIFYNALEIIKKRTKKPGFDVFEKALNNVKPYLAVKARRVGGATYQVPIEVPEPRRSTLAIRWIIGFARAAKGKNMEERLADELINAANNTGLAIKKRDDTHKMAEANKAFAHYRW
ncbi:MAG: 30S ribosomal protein S7 [bacterium]|nr:30S ribosomal protein S7 [bacterium]